MVDLIALAMIDAPQNALLRLNLDKDTEYAVSLKVERDKPKTSGEIRQVVKVAKVNLRVTLECRLTGMTIDGKDRSSDLARMLAKPTVTFDWTDRAQRQGEMTALAFGKVNEDLMPLLQEAGLYLCEFPANPVAPGISWRGSTTATGGCTSATYTLKNLQKHLAEIEVTDIQFLAPVEQIGPMKMTVDTRTGFPTRVEYRVKGQKTGRISHYTQTLASITR